MTKYSVHILDLARQGARQRLQELQAELSDLLKAFPDVARGSITIAAVPESHDGRPGRTDMLSAVQVRRPRKLSAAARKAMSDAQKRRWKAVRTKRQKEKKASVN